MHVLFVVVDRALALAAVRDAFVLVIQGVELRESELLDRQRIVIIPCVTKEDVNDSVGLERGGRLRRRRRRRWNQLKGSKATNAFGGSQSQLRLSTYVEDLPRFSLYTQLASDSLSRSLFHCWVVAAAS